MIYVTDSNLQSHNSVLPIFEGMTESLQIECIKARSCTVLTSSLGQRNKKWKNLFFVLNGAEAELYYFENLKVSITDLLTIHL